MCHADFLGNEIRCQSIDFSNEQLDGHTRSIRKELTERVIHTGAFVSCRYSECDSASIQLLFSHEEKHVLSLEVKSPSSCYSNGVTPG